MQLPQPPQSLLLAQLIDEPLDEPLDEAEEDVEDVVVVVIPIIVRAASRVTHGSFPSPSTPMYFV